MIIIPRAYHLCSCPYCMMLLSYETSRDDILFEFVFPLLDGQTVDFKGNPSISFHKCPGCENTFHENHTEIDSPYHIELHSILGKSQSTLPPSIDECLSCTLRAVDSEPEEEIEFLLQFVHEVDVRRLKSSDKISERINSIQHDICNRLIELFPEPETIEQFIVVAEINRRISRFHQALQLTSEAIRLYPDETTFNENQEIRSLNGLTILNIEKACQNLNSYPEFLKEYV